MAVMKISPILVCHASVALACTDSLQKQKKAEHSVLVPRIRMKLTFCTIIGVVKCFLCIQTMILCKWIKCSLGNKNSKQNIYKYYNKSSATCIWALLLWWFMSAAALVHVLCSHHCVCIRGGYISAIRLSP